MPEKRWRSSSNAHGKEAIPSTCAEFRRSTSALLGGRKFACGFDNLARQIIRDVRLVARFDHIGRAEELFLAIAQRVANGLLHLRVGEIALAGGLFREQFQDSISLIRHADRRCDFTRFHPQYRLLQYRV